MVVWGLGAGSCHRTAPAGASGTTRREYPSPDCITLTLSSSSVPDTTDRTLTGQRVAFSPQASPLGRMDATHQVPFIRAGGLVSSSRRLSGLIPPPLALQRFVFESRAAPCHGTLMVPTDFGAVSYVLHSVSGPLSPSPLSSQIASVTLLRPDAVDHGTCSRRALGQGVHGEAQKYLGVGMGVCARLNGCMSVTKADLLGRLFRLLPSSARWLCLLVQALAAIDKSRRCFWLVDPAGPCAWPGR